MWFENATAALTYVASRDPSAEKVTVPMSVVGALSTHRHLVFPKSHRRREGGLPDWAVASTLPSGLRTPQKQEQSGEINSKACRRHTIVSRAT